MQIGKVFIGVGGLESGPPMKTEIRAKAIGRIWGRRVPKPLCIINASGTGLWLNLRIDGRFAP